MESALHPEFLWAQTKDMIYMTITIPNVRSSDAQIKVLDEGSIYFKGTGGPAGDEHLYEMSVQLLHPIKASDTKCSVEARSVQLKIVKNEKGPYWERLLKDTKKNVHCKIDWNHWTDEDEEDDYNFGSNWENKDAGDLDFGDDNEGDDDDDDDDVDDDDDDEEDVRS
uniref:CS domain-containing protein n=2 Tax=Rhodosorus marinus TaxID=101924 RepID=A0A7S3ENU4_9RHOD|mmetsp:Transcript_9063/g.39919  ORF Transcript_9063/g.39919 Transcript_9063/m.39919 type:complete len:167 (+) Transcript_9063:210-710(+)